MHTIKVINNDWTTKKVAVTDRTFIILKNGKRIDSPLKSYRQIAKI